MAAPTLLCLSHRITEHIFKTLTVPRHICVLRWVFPPNVQQRQVDVLHLLARINTEIDKVFRPLFAEEKLQESDKIGLSIRVDVDGASEFHVNAFMRDDPVQQLFTRISRVLQSSKHLLQYCPHGPSSWTFSEAKFEVCRNANTYQCEFPRSLILAPTRRVAAKSRNTGACLRYPGIARN